jgi:hypothetical protein
LNKILEFFKKFDISPLDGGGLPKAFIFVIWGLNSIIFLGEDVITNHFTEDFSHKVVSSSSCTILKKVNSDADLSKNIEIVRLSGYTVLSSSNCVLVNYDVALNSSTRGPPAAQLSV